MLLFINELNLQWSKFCFNPLLKKQCLDHNINIGKRLIITLLSCSHLLTFYHCQCVSWTSFATGKKYWGHRSIGMYIRDWPVPC